MSRQVPDYDTQVGQTREHFKTGEEFKVLDVTASEAKVEMVDRGIVSWEGREWMDTYTEEV